MTSPLIKVVYEILDETSVVLFSVVFPFIVTPFFELLLTDTLQ